MAALQFCETTDARHAALIQRVTPIANALFGNASIRLHDAQSACDAAPVANQRTIFLERGAQPNLEQENENHLRLTYDDPASEATQGLALAAMTRAGDPVAADPESLSILALADRLAKSDIPVLIGGPTGTGKEVLSRFIHNRSDRADGPFIAVNCAAMPETMLEAMLFGHQKGAFTGATQASEGFFRAADGGTLLLDEIAEMPLGLQAKLLRALQEGEVVPIGSTTPITVNTRIIACANRDLPLEVSEGRFREDLYYRLNVFPLSLKPLRERTGDIIPLAFALMLRHAAGNANVPLFCDAALAMLKTHGWAGNVRELENVIRRALLLAQGKPRIEAEHIIFDSTAQLVGSQSASQAQDANTSGRKLANIVQHSEARAIIETLDACGGSRVKAARELGISERTLRYRLASFREAGIEIGRVAAGGAR